METASERLAQFPIHSNGSIVHLEKALAGFSIIATGETGYGSSIRRLQRWKLYNEQGRERSVERASNVGEFSGVSLERATAVRSEAARIGACGCQLYRTRAELAVTKRSPLTSCTEGNNRVRASGL